jgi:hypothetical protein
MLGLAIEVTSIIDPNYSEVYSIDRSTDESFFGRDVNEYRPDRWFQGEKPRLEHAAFGMGE